MRLPWHQRQAPPPDPEIVRATTQLAVEVARLAQVLERRYDQKEGRHDIPRR